ncbi:sulfurtransferase [Lentibacillus sediminis]|uniref:sulfurtransferase n=1 Tax=Lentibacillus sediminis TaxID=1940529 RepID=UPI000C1C523E|nr:sulfurtransferase [Lentibacillus sediminis]
MSYLISVHRLKNRLENKQANTVIVDVRFDLTDPDAGRKQYLQSHLPGAVYMDLEKDLSGRAEKHGGKHPLPDIELLASKLGNIGIDRDTTVVVYDQANEMFASRLWWLLDHLGHQRVYVLDGGYDRWVSEGEDVTAEIPTLTAKDFHPATQEGQIAEMEEVKEKLEKRTAILLDSRASDRYLGKTEPLYGKAGHIPGAKNFFWKDVLQKNGSWKRKEELEEHFSTLPKDEEIIVSCGSGISACPNVLALKAAGYSNVKLYPGSFSDWISYEENEVETKAE